MNGNNIRRKLVGVTVVTSILLVLILVLLLMSFLTGCTPDYTNTTQTGTSSPSGIAETVTRHANYVIGQILLEEYYAFGGGLLILYSGTLNDKGVLSITLDPRSHHAVCYPIYIRYGETTILVEGRRFEVLFTPEVIVLTELK